jgi:hypothetical protein
LQRVKVAGDELKRQLQTEYEPPQLFAPVLYGLAKQIEATTSARKVRSHIMLPTGRPTLTRIVVYGYGMDGDPDADLELPLEAGCSGTAWTSRGAVFADLEYSARNPYLWKMTTQQHAKVPANRKSMLCVPVHGAMSSGETQPPTPIATLAVDTTTAIDVTGWMQGTGHNRVANQNVVDPICCPHPRPPR